VDDISIDVHKKEGQICILAEGGEVIERRIRTEPARFAEVLGERPRARIVIEASTDSEWVARGLEGVGHEVIVADPNFAPMYGMRHRKVKTDRRGVQFDFIRPGKPVENAFIEAFNGRLRDECLNMHQFASMADAQAKIEAGRIDYNQRRPHRSLGHLTPNEFARQRQTTGVAEDVAFSR
jgi:putative transposase